MRTFNLFEATVVHELRETTVIKPIHFFWFYIDRFNCTVTMAMNVKCLSIQVTPNWSPVKSLIWFIVGEVGCVKTYELLMLFNFSCAFNFIQ